MADYNEPYLTMKLTSISFDTPAYELPQTIWSEGKNIRFINGATEKFSGQKEVFGTLLNDPNWFHPVGYGSDYYWVYASNDAVSVTDMTTHTDITPTAGVSANLDINWNGGLINNILVMNNGLEAPIWWNGSPSSIMTALTAWPSNWLAACIRPFKNHLIAMNVTDGTNDYIDGVMWSDAAQPGTIPSSWDVADPTKEAGLAYLSETPGEVVDGAPMGDAFIVYKRESCFSMTYVGGAFVFGFRKLFDTVGVLAPNCIGVIGRRHLVLTMDDLVVHDGSTIESVLDSRMRGWLFSSMSQANYHRSFIVANHKKREMWVCIPIGDVEYVNTAVVWNYSTNDIGLREIPDCRFATPGVIDPGESAIWDDDSDTWDTDPSVWNERGYSPTANSVLLGDVANSLFLEADKTDSFNGTAFESYVSRESMPILDRHNIKFVKAVYPRMTSSGNPVVKFRIGSQMNATDPINWGPEREFTVGVSTKVDCMVKGRYISVRCYSDTDCNWRLHSFDLEVELAERR
jgi:hypothetical protein